MNQNQTTAVCFGHPYDNWADGAFLRRTFLALIKRGVTTFLLGDDSSFDRMCYRILCSFKETYPHIQLCVVPAKHSLCTIEELAQYGEAAQDRRNHLAEEKRNRQMIAEASVAVVFCVHPYDNAAKLLDFANSQGLTIILIPQI